MIKTRQGFFFFSLIFFILCHLFLVKSFAFVETGSFPDLYYPWKARYDIRLSNCPAVYEVYRCFPDRQGVIENDPETPCEGVVPDYFQGCRRLDIFQQGSRIKVTSVHDEDGNDITHDISLCFEKPDQCFLGVVTKKEEGIGYIPIVNVYSEDNQKVFFEDIKGNLSFLQRNILEERNHFLRERESGMKKKQVPQKPPEEVVAGEAAVKIPPDPEKPTNRALPVEETPLFGGSETEDLEGVIKYENCHGGNNYLEDLLIEDPPANIGGFIEGLPNACTYMALKNKIKGHRYCVRGKFYYKKNPPCLSEKYHKAVHNSLMFVSRCVGIDEKILFDLFNTESSLHLSAISASSAGGAAQLTEVFIRDVNQRLFDQVSEWNSRDCLRLKSILPERKISPEKICDRVPSDFGSFLQNMFYGAIGFRDMISQLTVIYDSG